MVKKNSMNRIVITVCQQCKTKNYNWESDPYDYTLPDEHGIECYNCGYANLFETDEEIDEYDEPYLTKGRPASDFFKE